MKILTLWSTLAVCSLPLSCGQLGRHAGTKASVVDARASHSSTLVDADDDDEDDGDDEVEVALGDVPDAVKSAAIRAVPGLVLTKAEKETERGATVYSVEGTVDGIEYEVEVSASGDVTEIEREGDDD